MTSSSTPAASWPRRCAWVAALVSIVGLLCAGAASAQLIGGGRVADRPFPKAFSQFGQSIAWSSVSGLADVLIVVDTGATMMERTQSGLNRVKSAANAFPYLANELDDADVDYRLRVLGFHEVWDDQTVELSQWTPDVEAARRRVARFGVMGVERLLDVLMQALGLFDGRVPAQKHLIVVCDSEASTAWEADGGADELRRRIRSEALGEGIRVHILGYPEAFQRDLAASSSGSFVAMPGSSLTATAGARDGLAPYGLVPTELVDAFAHIADHWLSSAPATEGDEDRVLLLVDYSASMQGRLRAMLRGIAAFDAATRAVGRRSVYSVARFARSRSPAPHGVEGVEFSGAWEGADELAYYFRRPAGGSEDVRAALAAAGPWVAEHRADMTIVVTDEPPSRATSVADDGGQWFDSTARLYGIVPLREADRRDPQTRALVGAVEATGGVAVAMPHASFIASTRR